VSRSRRHCMETVQYFNPLYPNPPMSGPLVVVASGDPNHPDSEHVEADYVLFITGGTGQASYAPASNVFLNATGDSFAEVMLSSPANSLYRFSDRYQTSWGMQIPLALYPLPTMSLSPYMWPVRAGE
jgi:hypothetical protein